MQKTKTLGMNLFENEDPVKAEYFNANTEITDAAVAAMQAQMAKHVTVVTGSYTGTGGNTGMTLHFDRKPCFVVIFRGNSFLLCFRELGYGIQITTSATSCVNFDTHISWEGSDLVLPASGSGFNTSNGTYPYFAFLADE